MAPHHSSSTPPALAGHGVQPRSSTSLLTVPPPAVTRFPRPPVEVRTSHRRKKNAAAFFEAGRIVVVVPARLPATDRQRVVDGLVERLLKRPGRSVASDDELAARAGQLADRHLGGVRPSSIRWVGNQQRRWASCSTATGAIRISSRLRHVPAWVLDTVIIHELAHLIEASHSPRFRELAARAPRLAEADAFLSGYLLGMASAAGTEADPAPDELGTIIC